MEEYHPFQQSTGYCYEDVKNNWARVEETVIMWF